MNYNGIIGVLIEAIKELKAEVEELKSLYESSSVGIGTSVVNHPPAMPNWPNINN